MRYLFLDGWGNYSVITDSYRENTINSILLLYASLLQKNGFYVDFWDTRDKIFSKVKLYKFVASENIDGVIFFADIDNINSILRLDFERNSGKRVEEILLTVNEDLSSFITSKLFTNILYNERISLNSNIEVFMKHCNLEIDCNKEYDIPTNYSLCKSIMEKSVSINIGTGCKGSCTFCAISNSNVLYRSIDVIIKEIESLLNIGVRYFHIANHSFSYEREFIEELCVKLIEKMENYDFAWSCFVIPSHFVDKLDLLPLMVRAKLRKIEIGCESGSSSLCKELGVEHTLLDIERIINSAIVAKVSVLAAHFIIGSPKECLNSLAETKKMIFKLLSLTTSLCDIYIHKYFPEKNIYAEIYDKARKKRIDFVCHSENMDIYELNTCIKQLYKDINLNREEFISKIPLKIQQEHFEVEIKYKITTQIQRDYTSKTFKDIFFRDKYFHKYAYFSWEIQEPLDMYSPMFYSEFFTPDEPLNDDLSNISMVLTNYIRKGFTVKELTNIIAEKSNGKVGKDFVLAMLNEWESSFCIFYIKYLQ